MDFAIAGKLRPGAIEHQCGVVELVLRQFADRAAMHGDPVAARRLAQELIGRPARLVGPCRGQSLGLLELGRAVAAQAGPDFRQGHHVRPVGLDGCLDQPPGLRDVLRLVGVGGHLDHADTHCRRLPPV